MSTSEERAKRAAYMREYSKRRYRAEPEYRASIAESSTRWRNKDRDAYLAKARTYYHTTKTHADRVLVPIEVQKERRRIRAAAWREANQERIKEVSKHYRETHRAERAAAVHAREKSYVVRHTRAEWEAKKVEYGHACAYCGATDRELTRDHVVPIKGGDPETVDLIANIVPACRSCNSRKGAARTPTLPSPPRLRRPTRRS